MKYKLYGINKTHKTGIRGFWQEGGKLYVDNIHLASYNSRHTLKRGIDGLFSLGELSAFYTSGGKGYIVNKTGNVDILHHRRIYKRKRLYTSEVKGIIKAYGGATIHKRARGYIIEVYYN